MKPRLEFEWRLMHYSSPTVFEKIEKTDVFEVVSVSPIHWRQQRPASKGNWTDLNHFRSIPTTDVHQWPWLDEVKRMETKAWTTSSMLLLGSNSCWGGGNYLKERNKMWMELIENWMIWTRSDPDYFLSHLASSMVMTLESWLECSDPSIVSEKIKSWKSLKQKVMV